MRFYLTGLIRFIFILTGVNCGGDGIPAFTNPSFVGTDDVGRFLATFMLALNRYVDSRFSLEIWCMVS